MTGGFLSVFVYVLCYVLSMAILFRALLSWIPNLRQDTPIVRFLNDITEPILQPLRRVIPPIGMMDISPMIAMIALPWIGQILSTSLSRAGL